MSKINLLYAQSGGVTPVINESAGGVISQARQRAGDGGEDGEGQRRDQQPTLEERTSD